MRNNAIHAKGTPAPTSTRSSKKDHEGLVVAGAGYVGLATAVGFARQGHHVDLVEIDPHRAAFLLKGELPFAEPSLTDAYTEALDAGTIVVHGGYEGDLSRAKFAFICTPTPPKEDGELDTSYVYSAAESLSSACGGTLRLVIRSTVSPGTTDALAARIKSKHPEMSVLVNPEFLREGSSLRDFESPSRVVVGGSDENAIADLCGLYDFAGCERIRVDSITAELIKLGSNSALAVRVSLANELAHLAHGLGADIEAVLSGIGADHRIGRAYLNPGIGFGGACLPKDLSALRTAAMRNSIPTAVFDGAQRTNEVALERLISEVIALRGSKQKIHAAVIGVAFKPGSDSVRASQAINLVRALLQEGVEITIFDPFAEAAAQRELGGSVTYAKSLESALDGSSVAIIIDKSLLGDGGIGIEAKIALLDDLGRRIKGLQ